MEEVIRDPEKVLAALERAKEDAKRFRQQYDEVQEELADARKQVDSMINDIKDARLRRAVSDAGSDPDRVLRYIKADDIEVTPDGLKGFDAEFKRVQEELPELFDAKRRVGGTVEMFPQGETTNNKTVSQMQADRLLR